MNPMKSDDLISRSALEAKAKTIYMEFDNVAVPTRVISIADLHLAPTVDAEPVRHGYWIPQDNTRTKFMCSDCKSRNHDGSGKYCSNCGAKMDGDTT